MLCQVHGRHALQLDAYTAWQSAAQFSEHQCLPLITAGINLYLTCTTQRQSPLMVIIQRQPWRTDIDIIQEIQLFTTIIASVVTLN